MKKYIFILICSLSVNGLYTQPLTSSTMPTQQWETANTVFEGKDFDSLKVLIVKSSDQRIRFRACQILSVAINKSENIRKIDIDDLLSYYNSEKDDVIKYELLKCLWFSSNKNNDRRISDLAVNIIKSSYNDDYTLRAIYIMYNFKDDKRVEDKFIEIVKQGPSENYSLREAAINYLGLSKNEKAVAVIFEKMLYLLRNRNDALFNIPTRYPTAMIPSPSLGQLYIYLYIGGLSKIGGDKVVSLVAPLLDDDDLAIRQNAAMILGYIGDSCSVPVLCEIVINGKDPNMRTCAIYYLSNIEDKRAIPALKKALNDNYMDMSENYPLRYDAYKALQKLGVKVERIDSDHYKVIE